MTEFMADFCLFLQHLGHYMQAVGSSYNYGDTAAIASPFEMHDKEVQVTIEINSKIRQDDPFPLLQIHIENETMVEQYEIKDYTIGFTSHSICLFKGTQAFCMVVFPIVRQLPTV